MYALAAVHMDAEIRMLLQPNHLMRIRILPMDYRSEATPNEELEVRSVRTVTHIVNRLRTAPQVRAVAAATSH
ncbi:hypothetical protein DC522_26645 [Microvirga sp. KLBC 81]|uniref:hypothetical protein n=1 Tax=Microvirga sp. KLBC 81 TaxID=1862707 RepID=UPI000D5066F7|nr:hypothetical protein [Microvirga sp. KLBC 81]PVE21446.1 hypothetical protein DC522_26645 [Microvirga sp. KLBC 81]